jgi:hypothetical protein
LLEHGVKKTKTLTKKGRNNCASYSCTTFVVWPLPP